ncbi:MAG: ATP-binding protein [Chakrabartia sp.]
MTDTHHIFERIALALERLSPPVETTLLGTAPAYRWNGKALQNVPNFSPLDIALLCGIDAQKAALLENGRRLASGYGAHDILLWGARGAGKSALVKSTVAALVKENLTLRLVEASGEDLASLPSLFALLAKDDRPTIVFFDDLGFESNGDATRHLRSVLDGGVAARPSHVRLYVTSNRRHILPRNSEEQASAINPRDVVDDQLALADRFGLSLGFHVCDQNQYLAMVAGYAAHIGIPFDPADALLWAAQRGARSGRIAWHYAIEIAGRAGKAL